MLFSLNKNLDAVVLAILYKEDSYGYKLTQEVKAIIDISDSTLYPVLRRLQAENFLTTYDRAIDGRNRKYYSLTKIGIAKHLENVDSWQNYKQLLDNIFE